MLEAEQHVRFAEGKSIVRTCTVKLRLTWCPSSNCPNAAVVLLPDEDGL